MPFLKKTSMGKEAAKKREIVKHEAVAISLPDEPSEVSNKIDDYSLFFHGEKKIGKTSLTTRPSGSKVFLMTFDPHQRALSLYQRNIPDWNHFLAYLDALEKRIADGTFDYIRVVIDGVDIWYRQCQTWVCKKLVIEHPADEGWGKGFDRVNEEFANAVDRVLRLPCGAWFIAHSEWREIETRRGVKGSKLVPSIKAGCEKILNGRVDGTFAYDFDNKERVLIVRGDERTGAGHRMNNNFLTPKGRKVLMVPMGESAEEAYQNMIKAFDNKQTFITLDERDGKKKGGTLKTTT